MKPKNLLLSIAAGVSLAQLGAPPALEDTRAWMLRESGTITAVLALVIAAKLLGDALAVLR